MAELSREITNVGVSLENMAGSRMKSLSCWIIFIFVSAVSGSNYQPRARPLSDDTWTDILEGEWMVEFMAPWCPACRAFTDTWNTFAKKWSRDLDIQVGVIDVTENPGLSGRFLVTALPSIYHVKDGVFRQYKMARTENDLVSFIDDKKWGEVEPVSKWTAPDTIQMSIVGLFFKGAMKIRAFYTLMTDEYGIPEWGCYVIFAIATIVAGLLLGLFLVCICDFMIPSKQVPPPIPKELMEPARDQEGDIIDDTEQTADADGDQTVRRRRAQDADNEPSQPPEDEDQEESKKGDNLDTDTKKTK